MTTLAGAGSRAATPATPRTASSGSSTPARCSSWRPATPPACWPPAARCSGSPAIAYCTDATVMGGAMGVDGCRHIVDAIDTALRERVPVVGIWHSGGARLAEGVTALHAVGEVFAAMVRASGRIPQISVVLGPAAGGAAYGPALTDLVIMGPAGRVFVTGPEVVRSVTGENVDMESLGGPDTHGRRSGVVHVVTDSEPAALETAREAVDLLPPRARSRPREDEPDVDLGALLPEQRNRAYDVKPLVAGLSRRAGAGAAPAVRAQRRHHAGPPGRPDRRGHRQQPAAPRRLPGLRLGGEGGPVRADVRRLRGPAGRAGRRARLPARRRPGVGRRRAARGQAAARVRRGRGPAGDAGDPQVLRRRLHRDERPLARRDHGVRLAGRRGRRHGREGRRRHPAPQEAGRRPAG